MRFAKPLSLCLLFAAPLCSCTMDRYTTVSKNSQALASSGSSSGNTGNSTGGSTVATGTNVMTLTVNGDGKACGFSSAGWLNMPCVSVTICAPGTTNCQTIPNILVDTGSWGLRVFRSLVTVPLQPVMNGSQTVAECVEYLDGDMQWGQVERANVQLGGEPAVTVPIQVLDGSYVGASNCASGGSGPDTTPAALGANGILGVGLNIQDCGEECITDPSNPNNDPMYYSCTSTSCSPAAVQLANQVTNPIALLPTDNNGLLITLPAVPQGGTEVVTGSLIFGIGTAANNRPSGTKTYNADPSSGQFTTVFSTYSSNPIPGFIDSGSSIISFPNNGIAQLPDCVKADPQSGINPGYFCPTNIDGFSAVNDGANGTNGTAGFLVGNAFNLLNAGYVVYSDVASNSFPVDSNGNVSDTSAPYFDWGLSFFMGRTVYVGFNGRTSSVGTGPYWAY